MVHVTEEETDTLKSTAIGRPNLFSSLGLSFLICQVRERWLDPGTASPRLTQTPSDPSFALYYDAQPGWNASAHMWVFWLGRSRGFYPPGLLWAPVMFWAALSCPISEKHLQKQALFSPFSGPRPFPYPLPRATFCYY